MRSGAALAVVFVLASWAPAASGGTPESSPNLKLVASIPFTQSENLELFTRPLRTWVDRDLTTVTVDEDEDPAIRHFAVAIGAPRPRIIDVTDPERPYVVGQVPCSATDVDALSDGTLAVFATNACAPFLGNAVVSLANPYQPAVLGGAPGYAHHLRLHPDGRFLYLSGGDIYDLADPTEPEHVGNWFQTPTSVGHANLSFSTDGDRMYSATQPVYIFDTVNPAAPVLLSRLFVPGMAVVHDAVPTPDRRFLFVSETATGGCPVGGVAVWDVRKDADPMFLGQVWAGAGLVTNRENDEAGSGENAGLACSSHIMEMDPGGRSFTLGWMAAGTRTFDIDGLYAGQPPATLAWGRYGTGVVEDGFVKPVGGRTSAAKRYAPLPGYIFSADLQVGFYVSKDVSA